MMRPISTAHVDLDGAWSHEILDQRLDLREWGPRLRYSSTPALLDAFYEAVQPDLGAFLLYGSGDFHHLSALWLRNVQGPVALVSFDNHPDWDTRPPDWGCGGWINRALELPGVTTASVWGCGNFELNWPHRLFANQEALGSGRLRIYPWRERIGRSARKRWPGLTREDWRSQFSAHARTLAGQRVYVTVDMDCLRAGDAVTNWEQGLFSAEDIAWALDELHSVAEVAAGDVCGAWSAPRHARFKQWLSSKLDHPRQRRVDAAKAARANEQSLRLIWRALTGGASEVAGAGSAPGYEQYAGADERCAHP
jgi:hypothetical protein